MSDESHEEEEKEREEAEEEDQRDEEDLERDEDRVELDEEDRKRKGLKVREPKRKCKAPSAVVASEHGIEPSIRWRSAPRAQR